MFNAPESTLINVGCKASSPAGNDGCTKWDAAYSLLTLANSNAGSSYLNYDPANINLTYQFNSNDASTYLRMGKNVNGTSSGVALSGSAVSLYTPSLTLNAGTALTGQSGTGTSLVTNTGPTISSSTLSGTTSVPTGQTLTVAGTLQLVHLLSADQTGTTTTIAAGAGAGTSPTVSLTNGTDLKGTISVTTGSAPTAASVIATITFGTAYPNGPVCQVTPASASAMGTTYSPAAAAASFTLKSGATALAASTSYVYSYSCLN
jgi:hypothetical protein